jgi:hypothetical protein
MAWARLDDGWHDHPKTVAAGLEGAGLFAMCLTWAHKARKTSPQPGFVPREVVARFAGSKANRLARRLVELHSFEPADGGWMIHDFEKYLSKYDSKKAAEAGRKGAEARWGDLPEEPPPDDEPPWPSPGEPPSEPHGKPDGKPMARADTGASARRNPVPKPSSGHLSSSVTEVDARTLPLRTALEAVRLVVRWDKLDPGTLDRIAWLADVHGVPALVGAAQRAWQRDNPPAYANAWLGAWDSLPLPKPRLVAATCVMHQLEEPCRGCAADAKVGSA